MNRISSVWVHVVTFGVLVSCTQCVAPISDSRRAGLGVSGSKSSEAPFALTANSRDTNEPMSDQAGFEACVMKSEVVAESVRVGHTLQIVASRNVCLIPWESQNMWPFAAVLRIRNTSHSPMRIRHADGSIAGLALNAKVMDSQRKHEATPRSIPIDGRMAKTTEVSIEPGQHHDLIGDPAAYFLIPQALARDGKDVTGADVATAQRYRQEFVIDFTASFVVLESGKEIQVTEVLPTKLTVFVAQK
jgi:hypothetical protein